MRWSAQQSPASPRWHLLYFVLAAFDLATVGCSLFLGHQVMGLYAVSLGEARGWATRLGEFAVLAAHASEVNAPGNDLFDSRDVSGESARMRAALRSFRATLGEVRVALQRDLPPADAARLVRQTDHVATAMDAMVREGKHIFGFFAAGHADLAGARMATMDRKYATVRAAIAELEADALRVANHHFAEQEQTAQALKRFEYVIAGLIVLMVAAVTVYGHNLARQAARMAKALAQEREAADLRARFVTMASHEFRTPLATIGAATDALRRYADRMTQDERHRRLDKVRRQVDHMAGLLEDVLVLGKQESGQTMYQPEPLDLEALCDEVLADARTASAASREILVSMAVQTPRVQMDPKLVRQMLGNLVSNALKYSDEDRPVHVTVAERAGEAELQVRDEGMGIAAEDLPLLCEPFHRGTNVGTIAGTGLGLAIVKTAVDLHGGTLRIESTLGEGSTFTIKLPTDGGGFVPGASGAVA